MRLVHIELKSINKGNFLPFFDYKKWPPGSPDLNLCNFFLWGYLKQSVHTLIYTRPTAETEYHEKIQKNSKIDFI